MQSVNQREYLANLTFYDRQKLIWDYKCSPPEKLVLLALNMHADSNGECFPGLKRIAEKCGISRPDRVTDELMAKGVLVKSKRFDCNGRQTSNGYQLLFDEMGKTMCVMDRVSGGDGSSVGGVMDRVSGGDGSSVGGVMDRVSTLELDQKELLQDNYVEGTTNTEINPERVCERDRAKPVSELGEEKPASMTGEDKNLRVVPPSIGEDKNSAAAFGAYEATAAIAYEGKISSLGVDRSALGYEDIPPPGYESFERIYREFLAGVGANYGRSTRAEQAWKAAWQGLEPPVEFWFGLSAYCRQRQESFIKNQGKSYACNAENLLSDPASTWQAALAIQQARDAALERGIDLTDPNSIAQAARPKSKYELAAEAFLARHREKDLQNGGTENVE